MAAKEQMALEQLPWRGSLCYLQTDHVSLVRSAEIRLDQSGRFETGIKVADFLGPVGENKASLGDDEKSRLVA
jgi:hypothetical protein